MEPIITKEIAQKFMATKGEVRGVALKSHQDFILKEKGEEGLKRLEREMESLGCPIKYKEIRITDFYPVGLEAVALLVIKKLFNFKDEKFEEIGIFQSKISWIIKVFMQYFGSLKMLLKRAPDIWRRYYTVGDFKVVELNEQERYIVLRIEGFNLHPLHCRHVKGYCYNVIKMVIKKPVTCQEVKCPSRGDDYHEFLIKW
jgi:hypothetical protein